MSTYGYSKFIVGIKIGISTEILDREFIRFDPKTGQQANMIEETFDTKLKWGDQEMHLPKEEDSLDECKAKKSYFNPSDHIRQRNSTKIHDLMTVNGIGEAGSRKDLCYCYEDYEYKNLIVGVVVKSGSSYGDQLSEIKNEEIASSIEMFNNSIGSLKNTFQIDDDVTPSMYLLTSQG